MRKIISIFVLLSMLTSMFCIGYGYSESDLLYENNDSMMLSTKLYDVYKTDMEVIEFSKNMNTFEVEIADIQKTSKGNLEKAKELVNNINWEDYNLVNAKEIYLDRIQQLIDEQAIIDSYTIYIPKISNKINKSTQEYFGSIGGVDMIAIYDVYNRLYEPNYTGSGLQNWVRGIVNLAMVWVPYKTVTVPFTLLSSYVPQYTVMTGDKVTAYTSEERTSRTIFCKDIYGYYGISNQYVGMLGDMATVATIRTVFISSSPYVEPYYETTMPRQTFGTTNFYNQTATRNEAYNNYINRRGMSVYSLPSPSLRQQ